MADQIKDVVLTAFRQLLRPLVRILLRHSVSFNEFTATLKLVFIEVASKDFAIGGSKPSVSRVSLLTGLSPDEIETAATAGQAARAPSTANLNRIGGVLAGWHQDPEFTGPYGLPLELTIEGRESGSFHSLVSRYAGTGISHEALLEELIHVGVVMVVGGSRARVLQRAYIPSEADPASIQFMGLALRDLAETLDYNLNRQMEGGYFERRVWSPAGISPMAMPEFDALVHQKGQQFLELLDNHLTSQETEAEHMPAGEKIHVGVGVFLFSDANRSFRDE